MPTRPAESAAGGAEAAGAAGGVVELVDDGDLAAGDGRDDELGDAVAVLDGEGLGAVVDEDDVDVAPEEGTFDQVRKVSVELQDKTDLEGELRYSQPPGQAHVLDYLNEHTRFFPLWGKDVVYFLNKHYVLRVIPHDD